MAIVGTAPSLMAATYASASPASMAPVTGATPTRFGCARDSSSFSSLDTPCTRRHTEQIMQTCRASWQAGGCSISVGYGLHSQRQPHSPLASTQACYEGKISKQKSTQTPSSCPGFAFASSPALPLPAPASALVHPLACAMHAMKPASHAFVHPHHLFRIKPTKWTCAPG